MGKTFKLPKATCPLIDEVIDELSGAVKKATKLLEEIREANALLRDAAETWEGEIEEAEKERDAMDDTLTSALAEIADLKAELRSLERNMAA